MDLRVNKYAKKLQEMIKCETISYEEEKDMKRFDVFHAKLKKWFPNVFKKCKVEYFHGSLLIRWKGKSSKNPIMFMNHHDVVEASGDWKYEPFKAKIVNGKMYGRGTLDTKTGLFAMLQAADELIAKGFVPNQDIYFESGCNEETNGNGAKEIADVLAKRKIKFDYLIDEGGMIVYEPLGGVKANYAMIGLGERGRAALKFTAKSNGGHASTPEKGSPLVRLGEMMTYIDNHNIFKVEISDTVVEMLKRLSSNVDGGVKYIYKYANIFRPLLKLIMPNVSSTAKAMTQTTLAFTMASGSEGSNVIPETAYVIGDMRISHHEGFKASFNAVKEVARKFDVEVSVFEQPTESNVASYNSKGFKLAEQAVKQVYGDKVYTAPYIMNQCSDARFMSKLCKNCLRFTPLLITNEQMHSIHGLNECVDIKYLDKAVDFYKFLMEA